MADLATLLCDPDKYLDQRQPEWAQFERGGLVRYDPVTKVVRVSAVCAEIVTRLTQVT